MTPSDQLERDAALWREHVAYLKDAAIPGHLHIRMSVGVGEHALTIEKVLPLREIQSAIRGSDVVTFTTLDMFNQLLVGRWVGR